MAAGASNITSHFVETCQRLEVPEGDHALLVQASITTMAEFGCVGHVLGRAHGELGEVGGKPRLFTRTTRQ